MKFVLINGPSCSGKSTVVNRIIEEREKFYKLSYDSQKWLFSKYKRDIHVEDVKKVVSALAEIVCELQYNIVCDATLYRDSRERLLEIARQHGYEIIEINLESEYDVLAKRFDERVANALAMQSKTISNTSKERFREIYEIYQGEKNPSATTFRTDNLNTEELTQKVLSLI